MLLAFVGPLAVNHAVKLGKERLSLELTNMCSAMC